jgi:dCMP deaminase
MKKNKRIKLNKFDAAHMSAAEVYAKLSSARRLQVGCVIVKDNTIISIGYNGMPSGWDNNCEYDMYDDAEQWVGLKTKPEVLHAETNAIAKLAKSTQSGLGATMFITHAPCLECAKLIYQSGINNVLYRNSYRSDDGIKFLEKASVEVEKI